MILKDSVQGLWQAFFIISGALFLAVVGELFCSNRSRLICIPANIPTTVAAMHNYVYSVNE